MTTFNLSEPLKGVHTALGTLAHINFEKRKHDGTLFAFGRASEVNVANYCQQASCLLLFMPFIRIEMPKTADEEMRSQALIELLYGVTVHSLGETCGFRTSNGRGPVSA